VEQISRIIPCRINAMPMELPSTASDWLVSPTRLLSRCICASMMVCISLTLTLSHSQCIPFTCCSISIGVYLCSLGPTYETFSEVTAGQTLGVSAFGMSTVHETLVAASLGVEVFALSLCTNLAAGLDPNAILTHDEVKEVALEAAPRFMRFVKSFLSTLTLPESAVARDDSAAAAESAIVTPLPVVRAPPATSEQLHEALASVRAVVGDKPVLSALFLSSENAATGPQAEQLATLAAANAVTIAYRDIAHFPIVSASGRTGSLSFTSSFSGGKVAYATGNHLEGLSCEESVFLALVLHGLGVRSLYSLLSGASRTLAVDTVAVVNDCFDITTTHPVPHSAATFAHHLAHIKPFSAPYVTRLRSRRDCFRQATWQSLTWL